MDQKMFKVSIDGGNTFGNAIKVGNTGYNSDLDIIASKNSGAYIIWQDNNKDGNEEIFI
jgi:hypothetical protein